jgi:hypothetical protein
MIASESHHNDRLFTDGCNVERRAAIQKDKMK